MALLILSRYDSHDRPSNRQSGSSMLKQVAPTLVLLLAIVSVLGQDPINDRQVSITSEADVAAKRAALIEYVWGADGFPASKLPRFPVIRNDENPED